MMKFDLAAVLGAAGMNSYERSRKAKSQPRDYMGRWVGAGAYVKWKSTGNDDAEPTMMTGRVISVKDGKAKVAVNDPNGGLTTETRTLLPSTLGVVHSKARLPLSTTQVFENKGGSFSEWAKAHKADVLNSDNGVRVNRDDGYSMEVGTGPAAGDPRKRDKDKESNALLYQLYAPTGRSLGIYGEEATDDLDIIADSDSDMIDSGEATEIPSPSPETSTPSPGTEPAPAPGPLAASGVYSVPSAVQEEVSAALVQSAFSIDNRDFAEKFCSGDQVSLDDIMEIRHILESMEDRIVADQGLRWAKKVISKKPLQHTFDPNTYSYYATSNSPEAPVSGLISVNLDTGDVYEWRTDNFFGPVGSVYDYEAPYIEEVDFETAQEIGHSFLEAKAFRPAELYPEENNMFSQASAMIDYDLLDTFAYTSQARSADATSQARVGGKFTEVNYTAPKTDEKPVENNEEAINNASQTSKTTYFAIVDDADETLVMDLVAISSADGKPVVFKRTGGIWEPDSTLQARLTSGVPPTLVQMTAEDVIKSVIRQIDLYDAERGRKPEEALAAAGYALADGRARIMDTADLQIRINQFAGTQDLEAIRHIVRRATALNARDLVPSDMIALSSLKEGAPVFGTYGEVIVADASPSSPLESLQKYWLFGPHSAQIQWGTPGDTDRATSYLTKYLGTERARAFAHSLSNLYTA